MKDRVTSLWLTVLSLLLLALCLLSFLAEKAGYANLLMVSPNSLEARGISMEKLEELSEKEFLLTYALRQPATAQAVTSNHAATLVETNHSYAQIMGYYPLDGGFFTKSAMDEKSKYVTLNETAAFQIFGSSKIIGKTIKLNGEARIVTGVIQDHASESINLYVPAVTEAKQADSIIVLMNEQITEAYVKNAFKSIGVHDNHYDFINLSESAGAFRQRFSIAWKSALLAGVLYSMLAITERQLKVLRSFRLKMRELYFKELFVRNQMAILRAVGGIIAVAACIVTALMLSLQVLTACLTWQELAAFSGELTAGAFGDRLRWLKDYELLGKVLFWVCTAINISGLVYVLFRRAKRIASDMKKKETLTAYGESELA